MGQGWFQIKQAAVYTGVSPNRQYPDLQACVNCVQHDQYVLMQEQPHGGMILLTKIPAVHHSTTRSPGEGPEPAAGERMTQLDYHPFAEIFLLMKGPEYANLVADIRKGGLLVPIQLHEGMVLDGRNRYRACLELEIQPATTTLEGHSHSGP